MKIVNALLIIILLAFAGFLVFGSNDNRPRQVILSVLPFDMVPQRWAIMDKRIFPPRKYKVDGSLVQSKQQYHLICLGEATRETYSFIVPEQVYFEIQRGHIFDHEDVRQWYRIKGAPEIPVLHFNATEHS